MNRKLQPEQLYKIVTLGGKLTAPTRPDPNGFFPPTPLDVRFRTLLAYALRQNWQRGHLDSSSWNTARRAAHFQIPVDLTFNLIAYLISKAGDDVKQAKVRSQILRARNANAAPALLVKKDGKAQVKSACNYDPERLVQITEPLAKIQDIAGYITSHSPIPTSGLTSGDVLRCLYGPDEKIVILTSMNSAPLFWTHSTPHQEIPTRSENGVFFLTNPVDGKFHPNPRQSGRYSCRSEESITSFRFALLESDEAPLDSWLRFLALAPIPVSAIYLSGGRSVHALVRVDARSKADWDRIVAPQKAVLKLLGADHNALTAVRLSRLPQAYRGNRQQTLLYLNPTPGKKSISSIQGSTKHDFQSQLSPT